MVDAQGEDRLGLHVDRLLVDAGIDEDRRQLAALGAVARLQYVQPDRLGAAGAEADRRDRHVAALLRQEGDDPAGGGLGPAVLRGETVDLARAEDLEEGVQRAQVGFAEEGRVVRFQRQFDAFPFGQAGAVDAGAEAGMGGDAEEREKQAAEQADHGVASWRCCCWYQNLRRSNSAGSSGICRSHCSRAWRRSSSSPSSASSSPVRSSSASGCGCAWPGAPAVFSPSSSGRLVEGAAAWAFCASTVAASRGGRWLLPDGGLCWLASWRCSLFSPACCCAACSWRWRSSSSTRALLRCAATSCGWRSRACS